MTGEPTTVAQLEELLAAIRGYDDPRRAAEEWKRAYKLLQKTNLPPGKITGVVGMRDVTRFAELIEQLRTPADAVPAASNADAPDPEVCKRALRAFRKRLALTRLDEESNIGGHSPLTKGEDGRAPTAMVPPSEYPDAIWQELVRQGKLRYIGHGFYELPKQPN